MPAEAKLIASALDAFAAAILDPAAPLPAGALGREGVTDARRIAVYRNNVAVGLIGSLEKRYPVTRRLVGDDFFRAMAGAYVARRKPASAVLILYGEDFPDFVAGFAPARDLPYLADVARLENAWVEAYHAAEAEPVALADLAALAPERLLDLRFAVHPAARLLALAHPAGAIWAAHQTAGDPAPPDRWVPEDVLVTRPQADVVVRVLPPRGLAFARALFDGASLSEAAAPLAEAGDDPGLHLVGLIEAGALSRIL